MKKAINWLGVCILIVIPLTALAQQDPYYTQFTFIKQAYNPATAGEKDDLICVSALAHKQWVGFTDKTFVDRNSQPGVQNEQAIKGVAPTTFNFNAGGQISAAGRPIAGVGLSMFDDQLGFTKTSSFKAQVAYFIPFRSGARLSIGCDLGFTQFGYANPKFRARHKNDPSIPTSSVFDSKPELGLGMYYKDVRARGRLRDFYIGASALHINEASYRLVIPARPGFPGSNSVYEIKRHYYLHSGVRVPLVGGVYELEPAVLFKYRTVPQVDVNLNVLYNRQYRGGVGYRQWGNTDAVSLSLGYISGYMQLGYAYDITVSRIQSVSNGTHELFISYCFAKPKLSIHKTIREL